MAHTLTEADDYNATVTVPDDGDDLLDTSVESGFQSLANRTKYLLNRVTSGTPGGSVAVHYLNPLTFTSVYLAGLSSVKFEYAFRSGIATAWYQTTVVTAGGTADTGCVAMPILDLPVGAVITGVHAVIFGNTSHTPTKHPELRLYTAYESGSPVQLGASAVDATSGAAYAADHTLEITSGIGPTFSPGVALGLELRGEADASAAAGLTLKTAWVTYTLPS